MAFLASQYLFKSSIFTATTTATQGCTTATTNDGYTVPAATRFSIVAMTLTNTATVGGAMAYADVSLYGGTTASISYALVVKAPLYPGGAFVVEGIQKHTLPTGGAVFVTPYATNVAAIMTGVEIT